MKPAPVSEYMTNIIIGWMMPTLYSGFFAILLVGGFGIICAVMAFLFTVTYLVQQIGLLLNFSELSIHVCMAVSCFFSFEFRFSSLL